MNRLRTPALNLSIVLPCYNPSAGWHLQAANYYREIKKMLPADIQIEMIVVDDGSSKPVTASAKRFLTRRCPHFKLVSYGFNMGKGYAVRKGVAAAQAPYIIYTDIDFPYLVDDFCQVYHSLISGNAEVVLGL